MSIFSLIKNSLVSAINEADVTGIDDVSITITGSKYPSVALNWYYKQGLFKVAEVNKKKVGNKYQYDISFKDIDLNHDYYVVLQ